MMLVEQTTAPLAALPVAEFKDHLRLGSGFTDDGLQDGVLVAALRAALAAIEARTGKILIQRDFSWTVYRWRSTSDAVLPVGPVSAVTSLTLIDRLGAETPVSQSSWVLVADLHRPRLVALGLALPMIATGGSARMNFVAGYGPNWSDIPDDLAQAVLMLAAHFYDFRHGETAGRDLMPPMVASLVERYRTLRLGGME